MFLHKSELLPTYLGAKILGAKNINNSIDSSTFESVHNSEIGL